MAIDPQKRIPLEALKQTPEFQRLTQKQRLFITAYCDGGLFDGNYDSVAATRTAYQCKSPEVARIMSYSLMQNIRIIAVLNIHFNTSPTEEMLVAVDRAIQNRRLTIAQIQALRLKCDLLGLATRSIPNTHGDVPPGVREDTQAARKAKKKAANPRPVKPATPPAPGTLF